MTKSKFLGILALMICSTGMAASQPANPKVAPQAPGAVAERFAPEVKHFSTEQLEQKFWACENSTKASLVDQTDAASCSFVYEELKSRKFGGDFNKLMAWWKVEKPKQK